MLFPAVLPIPAGKVISGISPGHLLRIGARKLIHSCGFIKAMMAKFVTATTFFPDSFVLESPTGKLSLRMA